MKTDIVANRYKSDGSMGREGLSESKDPAKGVGSRLKDREGEAENNVTSHFPVS